MSNKQYAMLLGYCTVLAGGFLFFKYKMEKMNWANAVAVAKEGVK